MEHHVHLSKPVISQMLLNGFEAFVIKHGGKRRSGIEVHASLFGNLVSKKNSIHHHVEFISVDTTADMNGGHVLVDDEAQVLKEHLAEEIGYRKIGGFHTHPYLLNEGTLEFIRTEGCCFSPADLKLFTYRLAESGDEHLIEVVLTIKQNERLNTQRDGFLDGNDNVFEFSVGNCKCFIRAQAFSLDSDGNIQPVDTILHDDYLQHYEHLLSEFGRIKPKKGKKTILEYII